MKIERKYNLMISVLFLGVLMMLSSCQTPPVSADSTISIEEKITPTLDVVNEASVTPPTENTITATSTQIPTQNPAQVQSSQAEQSARAYFEKVADGDAEGAADLLSRFSLMVFQMTRGDAASVLQVQTNEGFHWTNLEILDTQMFDAQTILVHVTYSVKNEALSGAANANKAVPTSTPTAAAAPETKDELWPMRLENGAWLYNWNNLIDFRSLDISAQTVNGITILPQQLLRYSDRVQLSMLIQNRTNDVVVFGQANETLGTFLFDNQAVIAEKTQWILNPLRSTPNVILEVKGLYKDFPDSVEIRRFTNYQVEPWYKFQLGPS
ncbi:MAG: hypothetical protein LLG42_00940 [Chloroflexi bacterium]|nr:hypothetical protein [Chloroflexota bacterium]